MAADDMLFGERRHYIRKPCLRLVGINDHSNLYSAHLRDLGLGGAYLESYAGNPSQIGQELLISIPYGLRSGVMNVRAKVVWVNNRGLGGFGVHFLRHSDQHI